MGNFLLLSIEEFWLFTIVFLIKFYWYFIGVASLISVAGIILSALIITVLSGKMQFGRWEKYVHNFVLSTELSKARKSAAANIIKCAMNIWRLKRRGQHHSIEYLRMQRKLFTWVRTIQNIKRDQRRLVDNCVGLAELLHVQRETSTITDGTAHQVALLHEKTDQLEINLANINDNMQLIHNSLNILLTRNQSVKV